VTKGNRINRRFSRTMRFASLTTSYEKVGHASLVAREIFLWGSCAEGFSIRSQKNSSQIAKPFVSIYGIGYKKKFNMVCSRSRAFACRNVGRIQDASETKNVPWSRQEIYGAQEWKNKKKKGVSQPSTQP